MSTHFFGLTSRTFEYSHSVGRNEFAGTGLRNPVDMALGPDDTVYVLNRSYENRPDGVRVTICTLDETLVTEFGTYGEGDGQFIWASGIALDRDENIYICDEWLNRVSIFDRDGEFQGKWGVSGAGDGELDRPTGIAIGPDDTLYITDSRNHRVQMFSLDGQYKGRFGRHGNGHGEFDLPWGITVAPDGSVYVADWRNDRIQVFTADGEWQASYGRSGAGVGEFNRPNGVAVDAEGDIYVTDWLNNRVQVLAPDGRFVTQLRGDHVMSAWGKEKLASNPDMIRQRALAYANDPGYERNFAHPCAVKVDDQGRICVLDHTRGRIQVYNKVKEPALV